MRGRVGEGGREGLVVDRGREGGSGRGGEWKDGEGGERLRRRKGRMESWIVE